MTDFASDFGAVVTRVMADTQTVFLAVATHAHRSIVEGSEVTGAPGGSGSRRSGPLLPRVDNALFVALACDAVARSARVVTQVRRVVRMAVRALCLRPILNRTWRFNPAPLREHVLRVVLRCPEEQVVRIHALPVVAPVKNEQAVGNRAVVNLPRNPMGTEVRLSAIAARTDFAVAPTVAMGCPLPARGWADTPNLLPKPLRKCLHSSSNITSLTVGINGRYGHMAEPFQ